MLSLRYQGQRLGKDDQGFVCHLFGELIMTITNNVRVFDGKVLLPEPKDVTFGTTLIPSSKPAGSTTDTGTVVDGTGSTLLPGLIDSHIHLHGYLDDTEHPCRLDRRLIRLLIRKRR